MSQFLRDFVLFLHDDFFDGIFAKKNGG